MKISRIVSHSFISTQCVGYQYAVRWCRIGEEVPWMGLVVTVRQKDDKTVSHSPKRKKATHRVAFSLI
ncbi:hypothetical protein AB7Y49_07165 [Providencia vermicola]|uniref:hypothetical protein n=1 Tax=Providencia vermicola TaxID=333965 RepID=UPI0023AFD672|nr:hypothetical protein [Providencia vermicola]